MRNLRTLALIALSATGSHAGQEAYVANSSRGDVSVVDLVTLTEVTRIPVAGGALSDVEGLTFSADGRFVFVVGAGSELAVIDTRTRTVTSRASIPAKSSPLIYRRPGGDRLYISDCNGTSIGVVDSRTKQMIDLDPFTPAMDEIVLSFGTWTLGFSPDGGLGYGDICSGGNGILRANLTTNLAAGDLTGPDLFTAIAVSPDGALLAGAGYNALVLFDLATFSEVGRATVIHRPERPAFSEDGARVYVTDGINNRFLTFDVTNPASPALMNYTSVTSAGGVFDLQVRGDTAYLLAYEATESEVIVMDLTQTPPAQTGLVPVGAEAFTLDVNAEPYCPFPDLCGMPGDLNCDGRVVDYCGPVDVDGATFGDCSPDLAPDDFWTLGDGTGDGLANPCDASDTVLFAPDGIPDGGSVHPWCDVSDADSFERSSLRFTSASAVVVQHPTLPGPTFDLIRGDLGAVGPGQGRIELGTVVCVADNATAGTPVNALTTPAVGAAAFYVARDASASAAYGFAACLPRLVPSATGDCPP